MVHSWAVGIIRKTVFPLVKIHMNAMLEQLERQESFTKVMYFIVIVIMWTMNDTII